MGRSVLFLDGAGWSVIDTGDPMVAIEVLDSGAPLDLLLVDLLMPPQLPHGLSIANMARWKRPGLKIAFLTGAIDKVSEVAVLVEKAPLLVKPVRLDLLLETIEKLVSEGGPAKA